MHTEGTDHYLGVGAIAARCRVSRQTVHNWMLAHGPSGDNTMPRPAVSVNTLPDGKGKCHSTFGWTHTQVDEIVSRFGYPDEGPAAA